TSQREVAQRVVGPMAEIVGAQTVTIRDDEGEVIAVHDRPRRGDNDRPASGESFEIDMPTGTLTVYASPYAPFFGSDELRVLAAFTGIALDRVRLFQQEHEARVGLERADEMKTNFIALASHELRTPVTTIQGLASTLNRVGDQLGSDQRHELRQALERQAARM